MIIYSQILTIKGVTLIHKISTAKSLNGVTRQFNMMLRILILALFAASAANASRLKIIGGKDVDYPGNSYWSTHGTYTHQTGKLTSLF